MITSKQFQIIKVFDDPRKFYTEEQIVEMDDRGLQNIINAYDAYYDTVLLENQDD